MRDELTERIGQQELFVLSKFFLSVPSQVFESGTNPAGRDNQNDD